MTILSSYEDEFVFGDLKVYREFDSSHFISNARTALTNKPNTVELEGKFNFYSTMLEKAIAAFSNIIVDNDSMKSFLGSYDKYDKTDLSSLSIRDLDSLDVITIRPQYIGQYTTMVGDVMDKVIKGSGDEDLVSRFISGEYPLKVQRQVVKTTLPYGTSSKDLIKIRSNNMIPVSTDYIKTKVVPFVTSYGDLKQKALTEAKATLNAIREAELTMKSMLNVVNKLKMEGTISSDKLNAVNQLAYNSLRGILDIVSFTTYMTIRKLNVLSSNIVSCSGLYNDISNLSSTLESVDMTLNTVVPTDTNSIADEFINGSTGPLEDIASKIYDFHVNIPGNAANLEKDVFDAEAGERDFNSGVYKEVYKIYDSINGGLDTIAAASDEYLMVFDDIIKKAGFEMLLEDRYRSYLDSIDDVSEYRGAKDIANTGSVDKLVYRRMLAELRMFPELTQNIATICKETKEKMDMLTKRFAQNTNGEFSDSEAVNEIKIFLGSLAEQYRSMTNLVCGKLMHRLLEIGNILSELEASDEHQSIIPDVTPIDTDSNIDLSEGVNDDLFDEYAKETMDIMHSLELEYYKEKMKKRTGTVVTFEAPDPNGTTAVPPQNPANPQDAQTQLQQQPLSSNNAGKPSNFNATGNKANTPSSNSTPGVTTQDNDVQPPKPAPSGTTPAGNTPATDQPAKVGPSEKYNGIADKFMASVDKKAGKPVNESAEEVYTEGNLKFINDNIDEWKTRRYTNVATKRVDGDIDGARVAATLTKIAENINGLANNPGNLQSIKTQADANRAVLASTIDGINHDGDIKKQAYNFATSGSAADPTPQVIANGELQNQVQNRVIPRVQKYYQSDARAIADAYKGVGAALESLKGVCTGGGTNKPTSAPTSNPATPVMASTDIPKFDGYSIFSEADNATKPNETNGGTKEVSNTDVYRFILRCANEAASGLMNGASALNNDDIKELNQLTPRAQGQNKPQPKQPGQVVTASTDTEIIANGERYTAEKYLDFLVEGLFTPAT